MIALGINKEIYCRESIKNAKLAGKSDEEAIAIGFENGPRTRRKKLLKYFGIGCLKFTAKMVAFVIFMIFATWYISAGEVTPLTIFNYITTYGT